MCKDARQFYKECASLVHGLYRISNPGLTQEEIADIGEHNKAVHLVVEAILSDMGVFAPR